MKSGIFICCLLLIFAAVCPLTSQASMTAAAEDHSIPTAAELIDLDEMICLHDQCIEYPPLLYRGPKISIFYQVPDLSIPTRPPKRTL